MTGRREHGIRLSRDPEALPIVDRPVVRPDRNTLGARRKGGHPLERKNETFDARHDSGPGVLPHGEHEPGKDADPAQKGSRKDRKRRPATAATPIAIQEATQPAARMRRTIDLTAERMMPRSCAAACVWLSRPARFSSRSAGVKFNARDS